MTTTCQDIPDLSHKTAIYRSRPSKPAQLIYDRKLLKGRCLDYGCGHGVDARAFGIEQYDKYFYPDRPKGLYKTIMCNYVINTQPKHKEQAIIDDLLSLLTPNGRAYITVRRDIRADGLTKRGTYQRAVFLPLEKFFEEPHFCIYILES